MEGTTSVVWSLFLLAVFFYPTHASDYDYGIIIDAGSSGSRLRIYRWKEQIAEPDVLPDMTETSSYKVEPGISAYGQRLDDLDPYLRDLLAHATTNVPAESQNSTSIYLMATAGELAPLSQVASFHPLHEVDEKA